MLPAGRGTRHILPPAPSQAVAARPCQPRRRSPTRRRSPRSDGGFVWSIATRQSGTSQLVCCPLSAPSVTLYAINAPPPYPPPHAGEGREGARSLLMGPLDFGKTAAQGDCSATFF